MNEPTEEHNGQLFTNKHELPPAIYHALKGKERKMSRDVLHVTEAIDAPRIRVLRLRHAGEIIEDVSDRLWAMLGTAVHGVVADAGEVLPEAFTEEQIALNVETPDGTVTITGTSDIYDGDTKRIDDYKCTSVWAWIFARLEYPKNGGVRPE